MNDSVGRPYDSGLRGKRRVGLRHDPPLHIAESIPEASHASRFFLRQSTCLAATLSPHSKCLESRDGVLFVLPAFSTARGEELELREGFQEVGKNAGVRLCPHTRNLARAFKGGLLATLVRTETREGDILRRRFPFMATGNRRNQA